MIYIVGLKSDTQFKTVRVFAMHSDDARVQALVKYPGFDVAWVL